MDPHEIDVPMNWKRSAENILSLGLRKILVIGATDTGKSTYCRFLCKFLLNAGGDVSMIDSDIGQKDIGPAACITLGYPHLSNGLLSLEARFFYFVGAVSPAGHLLPMVIGTKQMTDLAQSHFTVINTTGLIHGIGRSLKSYKIEALRPDIIIAIENAHELSSLLRNYRNFRSTRISSSEKVTVKSPETRRILRENAFRRYFENTQEITLDIAKTVFQRTLLFSGTRLKKDEYTHSERISEGVIEISERSPVRKIGFRQFMPGFENNLLCGLADRKNLGLGLGIINRIDFHRNTISLTTPVNPRKIKVIQPGDMYITVEGIQLPRSKPPRI